MSDPHLDVSASSVAFSSSARRACSISWFLRSTSTLRSASCWRLVVQSIVGLPQLLAAPATRRRVVGMLSRPSVCSSPSIEFSTTPIRWWQLFEEHDLQRSESLSRQARSPLSPGSRTTPARRCCRGATLNNAEPTGWRSPHLGNEHSPLVDRALPDRRSSPSRIDLRGRSCGRRRRRRAA